MNNTLLIVALIGVGAIFAVAAWAGPKVIRAIFPENQHEQMIKTHRIMVIVAIVVAVLGLVTGLPAYLANT
ncbi:MAG: hypothetical protein AAFV93_21005 [Chloroflexota bacterium]